LRRGARFSVEVRYDGRTGRPVDPTGTLYGWISTPDGAFVANEPDGASTWYPVNDRPTDKATYDFRITVPAGKTAVANGDLVSTQAVRGWTTWQWRATDAMSSYLSTVSIGDYDLSRTTGPGGLPIVTAVDRKLGPAADDGLARTNEMISYFSQVLGPYPFTSYGAIIDDNTDAGYNLETQTRPIYGGAPTDEGISTYLEWLWQAHTGGPSPADQFADAYSIPADDAFWSIAPGDPGALNMFTDSVYVRGAMTMQALRVKIGDPAFFTLLRRWYTIHRGGTVGTDDLITLAQQVSDKDLRKFFQTWLYEPTKPAATATVRAASGQAATPKRHRHPHVAH
jgi:aminopeptidase N